MISADFYIKGKTYHFIFDSYSECLDFADLICGCEGFEKFVTYDGEEILQ